MGGLFFIAGLVMAIMIFFSGQQMDQKLIVPVFAIRYDLPFESSGFFHVIQNSIFDELSVILLICGALFVGFARLKSEDEFIQQIRYESLIWAVYFNCIMMLLCTIFVYGTDYFLIMGINIFSLLFFFTIRFHLKIYQLKKSSGSDE
jgi:hypothetical protein